MAILEVCKMGNPILRKVAKKLSFDQIKALSTQELIADMTQTMRTLGGVGIAAPQVGHSLQLCIIEVRDSSRYESAEVVSLQVFINPCIKAHSKASTSDWEGCLSVDNIRAKVERFDEICLEYYDEKALFHQKTFTGFFAKVLQHEFDHLNATLFLDRVTDVKSLTHVAEYEKYFI